MPPFYLTMRKVRNGREDLNLIDALNRSAGDLQLKVSDDMNGIFFFG